MRLPASDSLPFNQASSRAIAIHPGHLPPRSIDFLIFLPTALQLQLNQELYRPNQTRVAGVDDEWDQFDSFQAYDEFPDAGWAPACGWA